jgi:hypothetical protein
MKSQLNEVKRLQKIAGILKESQVDEISSSIKQLISQYPGKPVNTDYIDVNYLAAGAYSIRLMIKDAVTVHRFVKE